MALSGGKPLASSLYPSTEYQGVIRKIAGTKRMAVLICAYPGNPPVLLTIALLETPGRRMGTRFPEVEVSSTSLRRLSLKFWLYCFLPCIFARIGVAPVSKDRYLTTSTSQAMSFRSFQATESGRMPQASRLDNRLSRVQRADQKPSAVATNREPDGVTTCCPVCS
jgi:hypothetical protein